MKSISELGAGTGLKLQETYDKIKKAEEEGLKPLIEKEKNLNERSLSYGSIKNKMESISESINKITTPGALKEFQTNSMRFSGAIYGNPPSGNYQISIEKLAKGQKLISEVTVIKDIKEPLGDKKNKDLIINLTNNKETFEIKLPHYKSNLENLVKEINIQQSFVEASYVKNSDDEYQLVLSSTSTGEDSGFSISSNSNNINNMISFDEKAKSGNAKIISSPSNSVVYIDGSRIERKLNTINDAPSGLTLELRNITNGYEAFSINQESDSFIDAIVNFSEKFNDLNSYLKSASKYIKKTNNVENKNFLFGDSNANLISQKLERISRELTSNKSISGLFQIEKGGSLLINKNKILHFITNTSGDESGNIYALHQEMSKISNEVNEFLMNGGLIDRAKSNTESDISRIEKKIEIKNKHIEHNLLNYRKQFTALSVFYNKINNSGLFLKSMFNNDKDT